jgi:hypothetical protein
MVLKFRDMKRTRTIYLFITFVGLVLNSCTKISTKADKTIAETDRYYSTISVKN